MKRSEYRRKYGSVKKQALKQVVVNPVRTTIQTMSKKKVANAILPLEDSRSSYQPPSDVGDSGDGSSCNEPMSVPVSSSKSHLLLEENLATAPVPTINPRSIPAIPEELQEPLREKLEDEGLQNAVVHQYSKLSEKTKGQWVAEPLS